MRKRLKKKLMKKRVVDLTKAPRFTIEQLRGLGYGKKKKTLNA